MNKQRPEGENGVRQQMVEKREGADIKFESVLTNKSRQKSSRPGRGSEKSKTESYYTTEFVHLPCKLVIKKEFRCTAFRLINNFN